MTAEPVDRPGARYLGDGRTAFEVWAPLHERISLRDEDEGEDRLMEPAERGYHRLTANISAGGRYRLVLPDGRAFPDPASLSQPEGVHGPSEVVDTAFAWTDGGWRGLERDDYAFYELHTGTFTPEGTFDAIIPYIDGLRELGITAIELMPVAQFPGRRNWGYDGVFPYAVQASYGGLRGLQRLVDACHARGMAVALDVVYNHLGPEGNYAPVFGNYFTDRYRTPWGEAINFDGPGSDEVRRFFIGSALFFVTECHIDALRLDAVDTISDSRTAVSFVEELATRVHERARALGRRVHLFAETTLNDPRDTAPVERGGRGLDGQWSDDFHHALHTLLTRERDGYYMDFGQPEQLARCYRTGYVYTGQYSPYYQRTQGRPADTLEASQVVVCAQNHDQVGNRAQSDRLNVRISPDAARLAATAVILSPFLPLLFMGEEYGETAPFWYFVDHGDPDLVKAVREGRQHEFAAFGWEGEIADPADPETFMASMLNRDLAEQSTNRALRAFYAELFRLRRTIPSLRRLSKQDLEATSKGEMLLIRRWTDADETLLALNFGARASVTAARGPGAGWRVALDSAEQRWGGPGGSPVPEPRGGDLWLTLERESALLLHRGTAA